MQLIIIHESEQATNGDKGLLRFALSQEPIASVILEQLSKNLFSSLSQGSILNLFLGKNTAEALVAVPENWGIKFSTGSSKIKLMNYTEDRPFCSEALLKFKKATWTVVSNGRFITEINSELVYKVLTDFKADLIVVNIKPGLVAYREKVRLTANNNIAGFRRLYFDSAEPAPIPANWPHHVFIKTDILERILVDYTFPKDFSSFLAQYRQMDLIVIAIDLAGFVFDLETENGLLNFCRRKLEIIQDSKFKIRNSNTIYRDSRLVGKVLLGQNITIGPNVIIVGPTIICSDVTIEQGAIISTSIIGPGVLIPSNQFIQQRVIQKGIDEKHIARSNNKKSVEFSYNQFKLSQQANYMMFFRAWPLFSYARCFKRVVDCLFAVIVLVLFAPIIPFIALAIKINSPGPVFFKDKRQGLHGKEFYCIKFRTMTVGADKIQEKLRIVSEVDGPQFKMVDDPRINTVGRFLRETYIDEIPQFINVLLGQMSAVGPRPSPKSENTLCPSWRDARLSVRPGITGLWQVYRTRRPMKDFQEWIHYDIKYVRDLSLRTDLWICLQTIKKMLNKFIEHF